MSEIRRLTLAEEISKCEQVTERMMSTVFCNLTEGEVRNRLSEMGIDRHFPIEFCTVEVAVRVDGGIFMRNVGKDIVLWQYMMDTSKSGDLYASRMLEEEGIVHGVVKYCSTVDYRYRKPNGDVGIYHAYRYSTSAKSIPEAVAEKGTIVTLDNVSKVISPHRAWVKELLKK